MVDVVRKTKEYRTQHKEEKRNDFLQLMMDAAEDETGKTKSDDKKPDKKGTISISSIKKSSDILMT